MKEKPIVLAITAASGIVYGIETLRFLIKSQYSVELIISQNAYGIAKQELGIKLSHCENSIKESILEYLELRDKGDYLKVWLNDNLWANPSSGSYKTGGMIISPCSMSTLASVSIGLSDNLIERCADVTIKEGRKLTLVPRETPVSTIHLENMHKLSKTGVKIVPPIPAFYSKTDSVQDLINFAVGKTLDSIDIDNNLYKRWSE